MKLLITLFSLVILSSSTTDDTLTSSTNNTTSYEAVFDGKEGGILFFTDNKEQAITVADEENKLFQKFSDEANSYIGRTFIVSLKSDVDSSGVYKANSVIALELK